MSGILHNILLRFQVVGLWYSSTEAPIVPTDPRLVMEGLKVLGSRSPANLEPHDLQEYAPHKQDYTSFNWVITSPKTNPNRVQLSYPAVLK